MRQYTRGLDTAQLTFDYQSALSSSVNVDTCAAVVVADVLLCLSTDRFLQLMMPKYPSMALRINIGVRQSR